MTTVPANWQHYSEPDFPVRFQYPDPTPLGRGVELTADYRPTRIRVHCRSEVTTELYFEITRYAALTPEAEYARHTADLAARFAGQSFAATALSAARLADRPAFTYAIRWDTFERAILLVPLAGELYRLLYNPQSPLNAQLLATVEFAS